MRESKPTIIRFIISVRNLTAEVGKRLHFTVIIPSSSAGCIMRTIWL